MSRHASLRLCYFFFRHAYTLWITHASSARFPSLDLLRKFGTLHSNGLLEVFGTLVKFGLLRALGTLSICGLLNRFGTLEDLGLLAFNGDVYVAHNHSNKTKTNTCAR